MINWKITNIEYVKSKDGLTNVAKNVHWFCDRIDSEGNYGNCWGNQQLDIDSLNAATFISFDDLTEEQVLGWVKEAMGSNLAGVESFVNNQVNEKQMTERAVGIPSSWS